MTNQTEPVPRAEGTPAAAVRKALALAIGKTEAETIPVMTKHGMKSRVNSSGKRVIVCAHPEWTSEGEPALKLK